MKEGDPVADHVNEFNSSLSRLMSVDIKFNDEVQALLLLSLLLESWSGIVTAVSGSTGTTKLKFDNIKTKVGAESKTEGESKTECPKPVASNDKEVHMEVRDYDDALVCCVENTIDDHIMDSGASFHATYCKEELERFMLCSGKVRLNDDNTLDIVGVSDVILKTSFGNAALWHKRVGPISEKGMKTLASKGRIPDLQKAIVGFCKPCVLGKQKKVSFITSENTRKLQRLELVHINVYGPKSIALISESRYYVTFIDDNNKKVWVYFIKNKSEVINTFKKWKDAVDNETNLQIRMLKTISETPQWNGVLKKINWTLNERAKTKAATDSSNLTKPNKKDQVVLEDSLENLANNSIVAEHGLSSEITRSPGGSSDTSAGSKNSGSFKDSGRSDKEDSKDGASSEEGGSETP
ncbi:retrovirus-related pol polyprotein from transposon TNT 1-94 [Tanacetum coccineum]